MRSLLLFIAYRPGIVCGVGTGDESSEAVGTEIFGNASDPVQALGFDRR